MAKVRFSAIDKRVWEDIDPYEIMKRDSEMRDVMKGAHLTREANSADGLKGFSAKGNMKHIGKGTNQLMKFLEQQHRVACTCGRKLFGYGGHKEWFLEWLRTDWGKPFRVDKGEERF